MSIDLSRTYEHTRTFIHIPIRIMNIIPLFIDQTKHAISNPKDMKSRVTNVLKKLKDRLTSGQVAVDARSANKGDVQMNNKLIIAVTVLVVITGGMAIVPSLVDHQHQSLAAFPKDQAVKVMNMAKNLIGKILNKGGSSGGGGCGGCIQ